MPNVMRYVYSVPLFCLLCVSLLQDAKFGERWAEEASIMYERATTGPLKNSLLLHFAYADFEEVSGCGLLLSL